MATTAREYYPEDIWSSWHNTSSTSTNTNYFRQYDEQTGIWSQWVTASGSITTTSSKIDQELVWYNWQQETTAGRAGKMNQTIDDQGRIWQGWTTSTGTYTSTGKVIYLEPKLTRKERLQIKREKIRANRLAKKRYRKNLFKEEVKRRKSISAEQTAQELLCDLIGEEQMKVYRETGRILIKGEKYDWLVSTYSKGEELRSKNFFDLTRNVKLQKVKKDKIIDLCVAHSLDEKQERIPVSDQVIGFLLHAKAAENFLDKTANKFGTHDIKEMPKKVAVA